MPASSIDTFFACLLMVVLIVSAMVSTAKVVRPYINDLANSNGVERYRGFAEYLFSANGDPANWGKRSTIIPSSFGLAADAGLPYELDLDKVSRLNSNNAYSITYGEILAALGTSDKSLSIQIQPLFDVSVNLTSRQSGGTNTTYTFQISTSRSGLPICTFLQCYSIVKTHVDSISSHTASTGVGTVSTTLPNSQNGTALFMVLAKAQSHSQIISFAGYAFSHNSEMPEPNEAFLQLSPLNYVLNATFQDSTVKVISAYVFTYHCHFTLSQTDSSNRTIEYRIPCLVEAGPMLLVLNGNNGSTSFAEWTAYPQLPLAIGADFESLDVMSKAVAMTYVVSVNSALYKAVITCRSVQEYHA